ncbi:fungal-specific transcription factor domain-containing protein [Trametes elegans]|nr:fungal-specific transcription factor domain-containing protein [Trametes elegans]
MKAPTALQRGMACLCCRKRKMKCDGARPVCAQCSKANRASECEYYEKKRTSRTQLLQAKITKLEARLRELESEQSPEPSSSSAESQSPRLEGSSSPGLSCAHALLRPIRIQPPDLEVDFGSGDAFGPLNAEVFLSGYQDDSSSGGFSWSGQDLDFPPAVDDFLAPCRSGPSSSRLQEPSSGPSANWWENDVFCENKQLLLDIFFAHRHQCSFDVHVGRFKASLLLPNAQRPHPSLVDAILLLACYFSRSATFTALEPHFLKRSLRGISEALQNSDRIVHVLQASCLLAIYFFWHGRTLEGYYHSSIAARLAVGLGLHQIRSNEWFQFQFARAGYQPDAPAPLKASVPLKPPLDEVEYSERIAAFWQIFSVDRAWAVATGLPTALPDDDHPRSRIETIWPVTIPDDPDPSLDNGLLQAFPGAHLSGSASTATLRAKAIALFERTARFSAAPTKEDSQYSLEMSLTQFLTNLSNLSNAQFGMSFLVDSADLVDMQTLIHGATIHLHRDTLETQPQSYQKCIWAANSMTSMIRSLADNDYDLLCPIIATCWRSAAEVYLRILPSSQTPVELIDHELDTLTAALQRLNLVFPIAGIYATKVQEDRVAARQLHMPASIVRPV